MGMEKEIRKQVRNVVNKELVNEILEDGLMSAIDARLTADMTKRLDVVETFCQTNLKKMDDRAKNIQGFLIREVMGTINDKVSNAEITMLAWQDVMHERIARANSLLADLSLVLNNNLKSDVKTPEELRNDIVNELMNLIGDEEQFNKSVDAQKKVVQKRLIEQAEKSQQERIRAAEAHKAMQDSQAASEAAAPVPVDATAAEAPVEASAPAQEQAPVSDAPAAEVAAPSDSEKQSA